jgi:hypothetical protein
MLHVAGCTTPVFAASGIVHVACCMLHGARCMLRVAYCTFNVGRYMLDVVCRALRARHTAHSPESGANYATCNMQRTSCNAQHFFVFLLLHCALRVLAMTPCGMPCAELHAVDCSLHFACQACCLLPFACCILHATSLALHLQRKHRTLHRVGGMLLPVPSRLVCREPRVVYYS